MINQLQVHLSPHSRKKFYLSPIGNQCFFGKCLYLCDPAHAVCGNGRILEGSLVTFLPNKSLSDWSSFQNPWARSYSKYSKSFWEKDPNGTKICNQVRQQSPFHQWFPLLNLIDVHIFDFLTGNKDRHHIHFFEMFGNVSQYILIDNGKGDNINNNNKTYPERIVFKLALPVRDCLTSLSEGTREIAKKIGSIKMSFLLLKARFLIIFSFICVIFLNFNSSFDVDVDDNLRIYVQYKPEKCRRQADFTDKLYIHYTGYLETGEEFDSTKGLGHPISFVLGAPNIIPGWQKGIHGMCIGEKRQIIIPPELAYGVEGLPPYIPGGATLTFNVELIDIETEDVGSFFFSQSHLASNRTPTNRIQPFAFRPITLRHPHSDQSRFRLLRFLFMPFTAVCIVYYMYSRYKKSPTKKDLKELRRKKRN
ncbi:hypothetical protein HELRODRAFT_194925 [Helobdella robusta]|uniref:peptidylprolyl isomerase n=1 Tax=Helobdella robusta TaxID=6412 RepID=T1FWK7_HELRO|nr:hypothetical protein HELRODRAFT_194925 [Helobdella robusta]ESO10405.1 hypothetical protein HELRODRAFT_194925 [Helobdella robusta]